MNSESAEPASKLPLEVVLRVVETLAPVNAVALRSHDPAARCMRAFTHVCRATYPIALRLIYTHCLYIDRPDRLSGLLVSLNHHRECFRHATTDEDRDKDEYGVPRGKTRTTLPLVDVDACLLNMYLAPFPEGSIDNLPVAVWIFELFCVARHTLRRLVTSIPLQTLDAGQDHLNILPRLHSAFSELTMLEEFVCVEDNLDLQPPTVSASSASALPYFLAPPPNPVWSKWTRLRRLALSRCQLNSADFAQLSSLPLLDTVVLVRPFTEFWHVFFENVTHRRAHDVRVILPGVDYRLGLTIQKRFDIPLQHINRARAWNAEHQQQQYHDDSDDNDNDNDNDGSGSVPSRVHLSAVVIGCQQPPGPYSGWEVPLKKWVKNRAEHGLLWDVSHNDVLRPSPLDPDLWLDVGVLDGISGGKGSGRGRGEPDADHVGGSVAHHADRSVVVPPWT